MGGKASNYMQSDRPESGGANKDMQREKSGLLDREKEDFAVEQRAKENSVPEQEDALPNARFSIDNEPNNAPDK